jgi:hypothetical protein
MMSKKSGARVILALVWSCCWTIQVITGTPVGTPEMDRAFGAPLTAAELACVPTFGKAGELSCSICFILLILNCFICFDGLS